MQLHIPVSLFCKLKILYYISREDTVVGPAFDLYANNINIKKKLFSKNSIINTGHCKLY